MEAALRSRYWPWLHRTAVAKQQHPICCWANLLPVRLFLYVWIAGNVCALIRCSTEEEKNGLLSILALPNTQRTYDHQGRSKQKNREPLIYSYILFRVSAKSIGLCAVSSPWWVWWILDSGAGRNEHSLIASLRMSDICLLAWATTQANWMREMSSRASNLHGGWSKSIS